MMHARNSTREVEAGRSEVQGYLQLPSKLGYRKTCLKKKVPGEIWVQGYISVVTAIREAEARGLSSELKLETTGTQGRGLCDHLSLTRPGSGPYLLASLVCPPPHGLASSLLCAWTKQPDVDQHRA